MTREALDTVDEFDLLTDAERAEYLALMEQALGDSWELSPKQEYAEEVWRKVDWLLYGGSAGGGKACDISHMIPTPSGFTKMADIHAGDLVLGRDGRSCTVLAESETMFLPGWRIVFDDGSAVVVNDDHRWLTFDSKELARLTKSDPAWMAARRARRPSRATGNRSEAFTASITARNAKSAAPKLPVPVGTVRSTAEIVATLLDERGRRNHAIPVAEPLQLPDQFLEVDPYVLGAWLGDGFSAQGAICGADPQVFDECDKHFRRRSTTNREGGADFWVVRYEGLRAGLLDIGVFKNKHIPHEYLWAGEDQRLALLQGLMDTDGTVAKGSGSAEFCNTNYSLAEGVAHLARSLGMKATIREGRAKLNGQDHGPKWTVKFVANRKVFRLQRKLALQTIASRRTTRFRYIVAAERVEARPMKCIAVDSPDHLYLCTENMIPTHNSDLALHHVNRLSLEHPDHHSLLIRRSIPELRRSLIIRMLTRIKRFNIPAKYRKVDGQSSFLYSNGSLIECGHCANEEDVSKYLSAEYDCMVIDEASQLSDDMITQLQARLRTTREKAAKGVRPHLGMFTNPGGLSHAWLYDMLVIPTGYGRKIVVYDVSQGFEKAWVVREYEAPCDPRSATVEQVYNELIPWARSLTIEADPLTQIVVGFVPSKATDNPYIDPSYIKNLNALPERRRRQLRDGDWDVFEGQYFHEFIRSVHVIPSFPVPRGWQRARGIDFGSTAPYCCLWGAWDENGDCYIYREDYEAMLTPAEQARRVVTRSTGVDEHGKAFVEKFSATVADPSVFSNHRGQGKAIADMWRESGLTVTRAKNQRVAGWANLRQYLWDPDKRMGDGSIGGPRLFIFDTCTNLTRTIPMMRHDRLNPEDIDTTGDDHALDAARYLLAVRPVEQVRHRASVGNGVDARFSQMLHVRSLRERRKKGVSWN